MFHICSMKRTMRDELPLALTGTPFAGQFRYWTGASGQRYLHRIFPLDRAPDFRDCAIVLASVAPDGTREAVWVGTTGRQASQAIAAARAAGASEAHVHLLADSGEAARAVADDVRAAVQGFRDNVAA